MKMPLLLASAAVLVPGVFVASTASAAVPQDEGSAPTARVAAAAGQTSGKSKLPTATDTVDFLAMAGGYTHYWGARNNCWNLNLNGLPVTPRYPVTVSATEVDGAGNEFIGPAEITVHNVAVWNGGVSARVCVNWGSPIYVNVHYVWG
ncbi:hypothetical protein [Micromonospora rubida]|uniref:hypothetical protein n=1 Tax=Micromonospora rubida TaxID=2697657 RepID=UPI001378304B|nr:hypothetical protein [Micromonospora rubida]NBE83341.1 hypothetical protein [Micromonospora rubida]